ncbi:MAG TPA: carboxylating nicotinate-nucleotide diphosphorylase [Gemmataceae bacterium]|nr:carboxylating nicotinate-nucleotide diphosphorylase [Gemmataceae bacterium]
MQRPQEQTAFAAEETEACRRLTELALEEDLDAAGDLTSDVLIPPERIGAAVLVARQPGILAGLPAAELTFALVDPTLMFETVRADGSLLQPGDRLAVLSGRARSILRGERTALNFLQRLSGIATLTRRYVDAVAALPCRILDTRKTMPAWRLMEKYAVRQGGGHNHRLGLYDGILIKDNHLAALAGHAEPVAEAVQLARQKHGTNVPLEIEVDTPAQLEIALKAKPDMVLLDNMPPADLREAVHRRNEAAPGVLLEASGGVTLDTIRAIAESGVDRISVGALTHSAPALDIGLDYLP